MVLILVIVLANIVVMAVCNVSTLFVLSLFRQRQWDLASIERTVGAAIPDDAIDIHYDGHTERGAYLDLTFKASPDSISTFIQDVCGSILHQQFNPFNSIDVSENAPYQLAVVVYLPALANSQLRYLSYSPNAPTTFWGNRCSIAGSTSYNLLVDKTNPNLYDLRLFYSVNSQYGVSSRSFLDQRPIADFPLLARGLLAWDYGSQLLGKLCLEIDPQAFLSDRFLRRSWTHLLGADVRFSIDGHSLPSAYISDEGYLTPQQDGEGNPFEPNGQYFNYCYREVWTDGLHTAAIDVTTTSGENFSDSWEFFTD